MIVFLRLKYPDPVYRDQAFQELLFTLQGASEKLTVFEIRTRLGWTQKMIAPIREMLAAMVNRGLVDRSFTERSHQPLYKAKREPPMLNLEGS